MPKRKAFPSAAKLQKLRTKIYSGIRTSGEAMVTVNGEPLDPQYAVRNHSRTGFEWGYAGSGPAQLALAILVDHLGDAEPTLFLYQGFKALVIARLPPDEWSITGCDIERMLARIYTARSRQ